MSESDDDGKETKPKRRAAPKATGYTVAKGLSVTSKRGTLVGGEECSADDFGGQDNLNELIELGSVVGS